MTQQQITQEIPPRFPPSVWNELQEKLRSRQMEFYTVSTIRSPWCPWEWKKSFEEAVTTTRMKRGLSIVQMDTRTANLYHRRQTMSKNYTA